METDDMDSQSPPMIIETVTTERHDIREEVIEHVARLLCRADGKNPDEDVRLVNGGTGFQTVHIPFPANLRWNAYREQAVERLRSLFRS
jgi:hypothetical protein